MGGAAQGWVKDYVENLKTIGLRHGKSTIAAFYDEEKETRLVVHGDDFTFLGYPQELEKIREKMQGWYEIKMRGVVGDGIQDMKQMLILNRTIVWDGNKIIYKADPKHSKTIIEEMGLRVGSKGLMSPCVREDVGDERDEEDLSGEEAKHFRAVAARANYLGLDRPDIQYSVKELCREMAKPTRGGQKKLKRVARYLLEAPEVDIEYVEAEDEDWVDVYADSDWAGCRSSRKSTSGGVLCWGGRCHEVMEPHTGHHRPVEWRS